ncbi:M48 family metallopeptidase [Pseudoalteromonas sp. SSDWG2]|uniref:M48 family metallopeptidase n=1 Tax=Pseudoalteromonas sp. SSDWG2 TaxID=3139391 RepID=UPI003BA89027
MAIHIKNAQVVVRAPKGVSRRFIDSFVHSKSAWIAHQLNKQLSAQGDKPRPLQDSKVMLFGEHRPLDIVMQSKSAVSVTNDLVRIMVSHRVSNVHTKAKQLLLEELAAQLQGYLDTRLPYWQDKMGVRVSDYKVRVYQRRWGSCNQRAELSFNTLLVGAPQWVIDYVIVHELAHIRYMNHSSTFWQWVVTHYPRTEDAKAWLKENGSKLDLQFE